MRSLSLLVVAALVACAVATPSFSSVQIGAASAPAVPALAPPNRVVAVPINVNPLLITIRGSNLLAADGANPRITVLPAACDDCACSNFISADATMMARRAAYLNNAVATAQPFTTNTATQRVAGFNPFWNSVDGAFNDFTQFATRGLVCLIPSVAPLTPEANWIPLNVWISARYDCTAPNTCAVGLRQFLNDRTTQVQRFATAQEIAVLRSQTAECVSGALCSCFNPRGTTACCAGKLYDTTAYKCCANGIITLLGTACPCTANSQCTGGTETSCCLATKYPELNSNTTVATVGECYNPTVHRCCNTGERYNPGEDQCCSINGVQSLNVPCPCGSDVDCQGGQAGAPNTDLVCCRQVNPTPVEPTFCSIYANFPSGTGPFSVQRCLGQCMNTNYQICCNGATCAKNFEKCCNQTCCNTFTGACHRTQRSPAPGQRFNYLNFATSANINEAALVVDVCTNIRQMTPIRAFWIFVLPTAFLLATFLALAVALVYANKAAIRVFTWIERFIIFFAVILALLACPLYFSPLYKYGGVIALIAFWAIITAATRVRWVNAVAIGALIFLQIYLYDPFHGSYYFNLAYWRVWVDSPYAGMTDYRSNGILHTTRMMFPNVTTTNQYQWCTRYYDYFLEDPALKDYDRLDNPLRTTFGYCSRGWVMALYLLAGFIFIVSLLLLILAIMALINRFRKEILEPVELEVRAVQDVAY